MIKTLRKRIAELPDDATISDVFRVISEWEPEALIEFRKQELTKKSGRIHYQCYGSMR